MRCIVFGGAGFLGSYLCEELLSCGHHVTIFEKGAPGANVANILDQVDWLEGDFSDSQQVDNALSGVDIIFHLISTTNPQTSNQDPVYDLRTNVMATVGMLESARKAGVRKVIYYSSGGTVYGRPQLLPIKEDHSNDPICSYGIHKLAVEKYLHLYHYLYGLDYGIFRIANPYGPRQSPVGGLGVIAAFIDKVLRKQPIEIWGDGSVIRDYIYVQDVAKAAVALLEYQGNTKIFNIGSGEGRSVVEIVQCLQSFIKEPIKITFKPGRPSDVPVNILDIQKAREELGWHPTVSFPDGLAATIRFMSGEQEGGKNRASYG